jgi:ABC-type multidrug transport system fused ATPase/permease subunit
MGFSAFSPRKLKAFLGTTALAWTFSSIAVGIALTFVEAALAGLVQLLLKALHLTDANISLPFGLSSWELSSTAICLMIVITGTIRCIALLLGQYSANASHDALNARLRYWVIEALLCNEQSGKLSSSWAQTCVGEVFPKAASFFHSAVILAPLVVQITGLTFVMLNLSVYETLIGLSGLGCVGFGVLYINRKIRHYSAGLVTEQHGLVRGINRVTRNWLLVRIFKTQNIELQNIEKHIIEYSKRYRFASFLGGLGSVLPQFFGVILLTIIIIVHLKWPQSSGSDFLAFLYLFLRFVTSLGSAASQSAACSQYFPNFVQAFTEFHSLSSDHFRTARENSPSAVQKIQPVAPTLKVDESLPFVEMKNVSFAWSSEGPTVIKDFSLTIERGAQVGIVGRSGAGKSTLLSLILGIIHPVQGTVCVCGVPPSEFFDLPDARIGFVGPDPFLIDGTIRENLCYGLTEVPSEEVLWKFLSLVSLTADLRTLPLGLEHLIDETGQGLSAGQKQRLAIARALLREPLFLILDEASANLDEKTELEIAETLRSIRGTCTTLIVSHRPGILTFADMRIELQNLRN